MGRPSGSKEVQVQKLKGIVKQNGSLTNDQMAKMLGVCQKSVSCYLQHLRHRNEISVEVFRYKLSGGWCVNRKITLNEVSV
jgi:predicted ArsR family transcriptional regulator